MNNCFFIILLGLFLTPCESSESIKERTITLENQVVSFLNHKHFVNLTAEARFGSNWGDWYGTREGIVTIAPPIEFEGLDTIILPKENKKLLSYFQEIWRFSPELSKKIKENCYSTTQLKISWLEFHINNHPDKWKMTINMKGTLFGKEISLRIHYNRPEDGIIEEDLTIN